MKTQFPLPVVALLMTVVVALIVGIGYYFMNGHATPDPNALKTLREQHPLSAEAQKRAKSAISGQTGVKY